MVEKKLGRMVCECVEGNHLQNPKFKLDIIYIVRFIIRSTLWLNQLGISPIGSFRQSPPFSEGIINKDGFSDYGPLRDKTPVTAI